MGRFLRNGGAGFLRLGHAACKRCSARPERRGQRPRPLDLLHFFPRGRYFPDSASFFLLFMPPPLPPDRRSWRSVASAVFLPGPCPLLAPDIGFLLHLATPSKRWRWRQAHPAVGDGRGTGVRRPREATARRPVVLRGGESEVTGGRTGNRLIRGHLRTACADRLRDDREPRTTGDPRRWWGRSPGRGRELRSSKSLQNRSNPSRRERGRGRPHRRCRWLHCR